MKNSMIFFLLILTSSCTIKTFEERDYNIVETLYKITGEEESQLMNLLDKEGFQSVRVFVGRFPECMVENRNVRSYTLNFDEEKDCLGKLTGYHQFRWFELISRKNKKIYFLFSEKRLNDSLYERARIFYFSDKDKTFNSENGGYHFNREVRVYRGMLSGKLKVSKNKKERYIMDLVEKDNRIYIRKITSEASNKISGTKPLVYHLGDLIYGDPSQEGIPLKYDPLSSDSTFSVLSHQKFQRKR
jgi:hypothetical protein